MRIVVVLLLVLIMIGVVMYLMSDIIDNQTSYENAEANRIRAQAEMEEARGRARALIIDAYTSQIALQTEATVIKMYAAIPLIILGSFGMLGFSVVAIVFFMIIKTLNQPMLPQQHIYVLPRGLPDHLALPDPDKMVFNYEGRNAKIIDGSN